MASVSEDSSTSSTSRGGPVTVWLVVSQVVGLLSLAPWLLMAGLSTMAFDSGYSTGAALFVGAVLSYPALPVGAAIIAWILHAKGRDTAALAVTSLPLLLAGPLIAWLGFVWIFNTMVTG